MWEERVNEMLAVGAGAVNNFNVVYDERGIFFFQKKILVLNSLYLFMFKQIKYIHCVTDIIFLVIQF